MSKRKRYFNEAAGTWDARYSTPRLAMFLEEVVSVLRLQPGHKVLDVGTGTGILVPFLLRAVSPQGTITAVDYAEKMVQKCRAKFAHVANVSVELQDVEGLTFASETFDAVTCFGLFPHLEHKERALHQMHRVLKPRGQLLIAHALSSSEVKRHHNRGSSPVTHDALPEKAEMVRLLTRAGFVDVSITDEPGRYVCWATRP